MKDSRTTAIEDLSKGTISVETGTSQDSILRQYPTLKLRNVDKILDAVMDVRYGKSLAVAVDPSLLSNLTQKNPGLQIKWFPLPKELQVMGIGIGIANENQQLTDEIQVEIASMKKEGSIQELETKWNLK